MMIEKNQHPQNKEKKKNHKDSKEDNLTTY